MSIAVTNDFDEARVRRDTAGRFSATLRAAPEVSLELEDDFELSAPPELPPAFVPAQPVTFHQHDGETIDAEVVKVEPGWVWLRWARGSDHPDADDSIWVSESRYVSPNGDATPYLRAESARFLTERLTAAAGRMTGAQRAALREAHGRVARTRAYQSGAKAALRARERARQDPRYAGVVAEHDNLVSLLAGGRFAAERDAIELAGSAIAFGEFIDDSDRESLVAPLRAAAID